MTRLNDKVAAGDIIVIDGGMGTELERRGVPMHAQTWTGAALVELPPTPWSTCMQTSFAPARRVIITNTFGASPHMLSAMGHGEARRGDHPRFGRSRQGVPAIRSGATWPSRDPSRPWRPAETSPIRATAIPMTRLPTAWAAWHERLPTAAAT